MIHADVLERGWSSRAHSFRQRYGHEGVDAALLLMPVVGFLPADDRRITATIERIRSSLMIDGFVYRFVPRETTGDDRPVGAFEGSFLPCLFWLASVHALAGRVAEAQRTFERGLSAAGGAGLFSEEYDPRARQLLGNYRSCSRTPSALAPHSRSMRRWRAAKGVRRRDQPAWHARCRGRTRGGSSRTPLRPSCGPIARSLPAAMRVAAHVCHTVTLLRTAHPGRGAGTGGCRGGASA